MRRVIAVTCSRIVNKEDGNSRVELLVKNSSPTGCGENFYTLLCYEIQPSERVRVREYPSVASVLLKEQAGIKARAEPKKIYYDWHYCELSGAVRLGVFFCQKWSFPKKKPSGEKNSLGDFRWISASELPRRPSFQRILQFVAKSHKKSCELLLPFLHEEER